MMSRQLRDMAWRHINKAQSQLERGLYKEAFDTIKKAEQFAHKARAYDILSVISGIIGRAMHSAGLYDEALKSYTIALNIQKELPKSELIFNVWVALTLNNLGILLADMGRPKEAEKRYEDALKMREKLLESNPKNVSYQSDVAMTLNNLGTLLAEMGMKEEAKKRFEYALKLNKKLLESDSENVLYQSNVAMSLSNLGAILMAMGKIEETKKPYEDALRMHEKLLENDPENVLYQSKVAGILNNIGNLLLRIGKIGEAKQKYNAALKIHEKLLENDPENVSYQSKFATILYNLGVLLEDKGMTEEAKKCYEKSLGACTEPMQYMTIRAKSRAIINIIQLVLECAKKETNLSKKQDYFKDAYEAYKQHNAFFIKYELNHENRLARESGLSAHIQYLILNAKNETDTDKRIEEYEKCIQEVKKIAEIEDDEKLEKLWSSVMHYLEGRQLVNRAIKSSPPEKDLIKQAIDRFKLAKDIYKHANVCYCVYTVLLGLESIDFLDDKAVTGMKKLIHEAIDNLPEELDISVKSAFKEIELLLDKKNVKADIEMFIKLNRCITKIDYYALREHFSYIYENIASYLKEPFSPNVSYSNWTLTFTFDEPEKVQGKLTITASACK